MNPCRAQRPTAADPVLDTTASKPSDRTALATLRRAPDRIDSRVGSSFRQGQAPARTVSPGQQSAQFGEPIDYHRNVDWALAENTRQGSLYFGRIDPKQVAVLGFSCGGLQAALVANDPRVTTLIMQNTGTYDGERATMPGLKVPSPR